MSARSNLTKFQIFFIPNAYCTRVIVDIPRVVKDFENDIQKLQWAEFTNQHVFTLAHVCLPTLIHKTYLLTSPLCKYL